MDTGLAEGTVTQKKGKGKIAFQVRRLTDGDLDPAKARNVERIFKVITELIANEDILDWSVLSDPRTVVLGIFEGVLLNGEFTDPFLIGMATANFKHTWTGWKIIVDDVIVSEKNRAKGVGRALMAETERLGAEHEPPCKVVQLTSDREYAFGFYERIGYKPTKGVPFKKTL